MNDPIAEVLHEELRGAAQVHLHEGLHIGHAMNALLRHHRPAWPGPHPAPQAPKSPVVRPLIRHMDALELLGRDHRSIKRMFRDFAVLVEQRAGDVEGRAAIVGRLCCGLMLHAQLEDEVFYPAVHAHLGSDVWTHHASDEHNGCQALIARLDEMEPGDADFDAVVFTIGAYIEPHIDEEQGLLFPAIRRSGMNVAVLGRRILEHRKLLQEDVTLIGLPQLQARVSKYTTGAQRACAQRRARRAKNPLKCVAQRTDRARSRRLSSGSDTE